jgi:anti-anti-sigma factor
MSVNVELKSDVGELNIKISGRFDFSVHQEFRKATEKISSAVKQVIVDLRATDYVDSSALGMLLVLRDKIGSSKQNVRIINANPEVKKILEIASFDKLFTLA